ncbi:hypothetical protein [Methanospirillum sp.]|uniref:hypothetical protein n=1 Tax=Methanospirillum sp. TaxID=45200 RepID=UPI00359F691E
MISDKKIICEYLIVILLYAILTAILTYPMVLHVSDTIGGGDEAFTCWSLTWTTKKVLEDPLNLFHANIFYPANDYSLALSEHMLGWTIFSIPVYGITHDPVFTHNFVRLLTFVLCGFGMYLLVYHYTQNRYAAFIAGIFFAFFGYRMAIQLHLLAMQWVPFMLLFLDKFFHSLKFRDIGAASLFFVLSALSSWYVGIFTAIVGGLFILGYIILDSSVRSSIATKKPFFTILVSLFLVIIILTPISLPYFEASKHYDAERDIDVPTNSSWSFDIPFLINQFGIFLIIFAIAGLLLPLSEYRFKLPNLDYVKKQKIPIIFMGIAIVSYILTLGPVLKLNSILTEVMMPYYYIYSIFPYIAIIRALPRFSFIISLAVSVLAGLGAAALLNRIKRDDIKKIVAIGFVFLAILGSWHVPVNMPVSLATGDQVPVEYRWLAEKPDDTKIIEIPTRWVEDNSEYVYYSVYHWKEMVNGYSGRDVEFASKIMRDTGSYFPSDNTVSLLQYIGIKYVIIHADRIRILENVPDEQAEIFISGYLSNLNQKIEENYNSSIKMAASFDNTVVYEILKTPEVLPDDVILLFQSGWFGSNTFPEFYLKEKGKIMAFTGSTGEYLLYFLAEPVYSEKDLSLTVNGENMGTITALSGDFTEGRGNFILNKGMNEIKFTSMCTKLCDIPELNTISDKCMSFKFVNLTVFQP